MHTLTRNGASCAPPLARAAQPRDLAEALPAGQGLLASTCVLAPRACTQQRASAPRERPSRDSPALHLAGRERCAPASFQACWLAPPPGSRDCLPAHQCWSENRPALEGDLRAHLLLAWLSAQRAPRAPATARTARTALRARRAVRTPRTHYNWPASALTLRALRHLVLASRRTVWRHARRVQRAIRELNRLRVERENSPAAKRLIGSTLAACLKVGLNAWNLLVGYRVSHLRLA